MSKEGDAVVAEFRTLGLELAAQRGKPEGALNKRWTFDWKFRSWSAPLQDRLCMIVSINYTDFRWTAAFNGKPLESFSYLFPDGTRLDSQYTNARDGMAMCEKVGKLLGYTEIE